MSKKIDVDSFVKRYLFHAEMKARDELDVILRELKKYECELYTKDEVIEMFTELKDLIDKLPNKRHYITENGVTYGYKDYEPSAKDASQLVQAKINQLRGEE